MHMQGGKIYKDSYFSLRSGRPDTFDSMYFTYDETCVAPFNAANPKTYTTNETMVNNETVM
jgi:hypothetical protein